MSDTRTAKEIELANLNEARGLLMSAMGGISGFGPDWQKAVHALKYIDAQRNPIMAAMLAESDEQVAA